MLWHQDEEAFGKVDLNHGYWEELFDGEFHKGEGGQRFLESIPVELESLSF